MVKKPVRAIVGAIANAAARWSDRSFAPRVAASEATQARTGYGATMVDFAFDALFAELNDANIEAVIKDELGSVDVLDGFVSRLGRAAVHALPIGRVCIVSSRTTVGVAIWPAAFALCAKCPVTVKDRDDHFAAAFFKTVAAELGGGDAVEAQTWNGAADSRKLGGFDLVVAFGNDATLQEISAQLSFPTRFVGHGSKASAGYLTREALNDDAEAQRIAQCAARDLVLYDTEGCLSLHVLFVERGAAVSPEAFGAMLADCVRAAHVAFSSTHRPDSASRVALLRDRKTLAAPDHVHADSQGSFLVTIDAPAHEPPFFLPRALNILSVDDPSEALTYLEAHRITLEGFAVEQSRPDVVEAAQCAGASRITRFGALQRPPLGGFHGGRPRIAEFVRWIVNET